MAQIGCYLTDNEAKNLVEYAASIELTRPAVCALLIQRELRKPQLRRSWCRRNAVPPKDDERRVTVHVRNTRLKAAFNDHVKSLGMGSDEAAAALFRNELEKRWLFKMFGKHWNHS